MHASRERPAYRLAAPVAVAAFLAGAPPVATAESDPYYFGISQSLGHDSNLYRSTTSEVPDKFAVTSLNLGFDQPIGRQRVFASASARSTRYEDITVLNNTGYGLNAGLDWSTIERLSGNLGVALNRSLANYAAAGNQVATINKNLETTGQGSFRVQLGLVSQLSLNLALSHSEVAYSAAEYQFSEVRQDAASLGFTVRPSGLLSMGGALRVTKGEYPNIANEEFDRKDLDLTTTWVASGLSTLNARVSYGRSAFDRQTSRNTKGTTGALAWSWRPTGKLTFNTTLSRDSGTETTLYTLANSQGQAVGDNSVLTNAIGLSVGYEATSKIRLNLAARHSRRTLVNDVVFGGVVQSSTVGRDRASSTSLGAHYALSRAWQFACQAEQSTSTPTSGAANVSTRFTATSASCSVQFTIR